MAQHRWSAIGMGGRGPPAERGMKFICIDDQTPEETCSLLAGACAARDVAFERIHAPSFWLGDAPRIGPGDLIYRPAVSLAAIRVEQLLWSSDLASFYLDPLGPFFHADAYPLMFQAQGLPYPRTLPVMSVTREAIDAAVEALGGYPVVVKALGGEGGVGVMRFHGGDSLRPTLEYLLSIGVRPYLSAFVDQAVHWRVVVVGDRAVAAYRNTPLDDDFRTIASLDPADFTSTPSEALSDLALRAARAVRVDMAGVDILEHPSGRLYLLEANFPCYFPHAQLVAGIDVAGALIDRLIERSGARQ